MSSMAKIFVVVNLIFSVVVFGSAATLLGAQDNYKEALRQKTEEFVQVTAAKDTEIARLTKDVNSQTNRASQAVAEKTNAEASLEGTRSQLAETKSVNDRLTATVEKQSQELQALRATIDNFKEWLDRYGNEAATATKDKLNFQNKWQEEVNNRVRLEEEVKKLSDELSTLAAAKGDVEKDLKNRSFWLDKYRERFGDITGGPGGAEGRVLSVRGNLVSISVGSADGVKIGDVYQLSRGSSYVGQITITKVYKDQAVGEFDTEFTGSGAPPMPNDVAQPRTW